MIAIIINKSRDMIEHVTESAKTITVEGFYVLVAALGGVARYLQKYLEEGKFGWKHLLAHMIVSAFSGYMFGEFGLWVGLGDKALFLLVGMGGYMGTESLKVVEAVLLKRLNTQKKQDEHTTISG